MIEFEDKLEKIFVNFGFLLGILYTFVSIFMVLEVIA
jgi:hypothetical protein